MSLQPIPRRRSGESHSKTVTAKRSPSSAAPLTSKAGAQLRDGFFWWRLDRFDRKFTMKGLDRLHAQEVYVASNVCDKPLRLFPLLWRPRELQVNMSAAGAGGGALAILSNAELSDLYRDLFTDAIALLREANPAPPAPLNELIQERRWRHLIFDTNWCETHVKDEQFCEELLVYVQGLLQSFGDQPNVREIATVAFFDYLLSRMAGYYRPFVYLDSRVEATDTEIEEKVIVKYRAEGATGFGFAERFEMARKGRLVVELEYPIAENTSSHFRFLPPDGAIIAGIGYSDTASRGVVSSDQAQFYVSKERSDRVYSSDEDVVFSLDAVIAQAPSVRFMSALLLAIAALLPLVIIEETILTTHPAPFQHLSLDRFWATFALVQRVDFLDVLSIPVAVALGLLAFSWEKPVVRPFAIWQVVKAGVLLGLWYLAAVLPILGLVALIIGVWQAAAQAMEGRSVSTPLNFVYEEKVPDDASSQAPA